MKFVSAFALAFCAALNACGGSSGGQAPSLAQAEPIVTATPAYGTVGSGPVIVVLASDEHDTLTNSATTSGIVAGLVSANYTVVSLDLPCHGADADPTGLAPLDCWAKRIHDGDNDLFLRFCAGLTNVLNSMHVQSAAILGISRGGYMAATCAAYENRFTQIVMEIPVTDLNYLVEFHNLPADEALFNLQQYIPYLEDRKRMVSIDKDDTRVGTDLAVAFAQALGADLELTDSPDHQILPADAAAAISWLASQGPP